LRYLLQDGLPDPAAWSIPANLRIEDGLLRYNYARRRQGTDAQSALDEFIDLVGAKPTRLLGFVKKWGPLRLAPELDQDGAGWRERLDVYEIFPRSFYAARHIHALLQSAQAATGGAKTLWGIL
jgi:hypothetical protein